MNTDRDFKTTLDEALSGAYEADDSRVLQLLRTIQPTADIDRYLEWPTYYARLNSIAVVGQFSAIHFLPAQNVRFELVYLESAAAVNLGLADRTTVGFAATAPGVNLGRWGRGGSAGANAPPASTLFQSGISSVATQIVGPTIAVSIVAPNAHLAARLVPPFIGDGDKLLVFEGQAVNTAITLNLFWQEKGKAAR